MNRKVRAVFLDVGGTMVATRRPAGETYALVSRRYGCAASEERVRLRFEEVWKVRIRTLNGPLRLQDERKFWEGVVREVFEPLGGVEEWEAFFEELHQFYQRAEAWTVFPETVEVLSELRGRGLTLAVVSNWNPMLPELLELLELRGYFHHLAVSASVGASKPDARIFRHALIGTGIPAEETIHVGDVLQDDVEGARGVGVRGILLDRHGHGPLDGVPTIRSLSEIFNHLDVRQVP